MPPHNAVPTNDKQPAPGSGPGRSQQEFDLVVGSILFVPFAGAFFDRVMLPEVAAGVEWTGCIRNTPWERGLRSAASEQLVFAGSEADRRAEGEWLLTAHREVKGIGFNGKRFSALNPESWNWILMSAIWAYQQVHATLAGRVLTDQERQDFYEFLLGKYEHLQLPAHSARLPRTHAEFMQSYDRTITEKGETNIAVQQAVATLLNPPAPPFLPKTITPAWTPLARIAGHLSAVCSFAIMHPTARELVNNSPRLTPGQLVKCDPRGQLSRAR